MEHSPPTPFKAPPTPSAPPPPPPPHTHTTHTHPPPPPPPHTKHAYRRQRAELLLPCRVVQQHQFPQAARQAAQLSWQGVAPCVRLCGSSCRWDGAPQAQADVCQHQAGEGRQAQKRRRQALRRGGVGGRRGQGRCERAPRKGMQRAARAGTARLPVLLAPAPCAAPVSPQGATPRAPPPPLVPPLTSRNRKAPAVPALPGLQTLEGEAARGRRGGGSL